MMVREVPFISNTPDDTHCFQAAVAMVQMYFDPTNRMTFKELDKITAKIEGKWTWPMAGLLWFYEHGFEVKHIEKFDFKKFTFKGKEYLIEIYGKEIADIQEQKSDLSQEMAFSTKFCEVVRPEYRVPTIKDIADFLKDGYLVITNVNARALNGKEGYAGHFLVIYDTKNDSIFFHDPGLPAQEGRSASQDIFDKAWGYPNELAKNISAVKLTNFDV